MCNDCIHTPGLRLTAARIQLANGRLSIELPQGGTLVILADSVAGLHVTADDVGRHGEPLLAVGIEAAREFEF